jgi:hypothetical protein
MNAKKNKQYQEQEPRKIIVGNLLILIKPDNWVAIYFTEKRIFGEYKMKAME